MSDENKNISNVFQNDEIIDKHNKRKRKKERIVSQVEKQS